MTATAARRVLARSDEIARIVARLAHEIVEPNQAQEGLVVLGVRRGGEALAVRLAAEIERISGSRPALGFLNINLYRDDRVTHELPDSQIPVDVSGRVVIVVDDVLVHRPNDPFGTRCRDRSGAPGGDSAVRSSGSRIARTPDSAGLRWPLYADLTESTSEGRTLARSQRFRRSDDIRTRRCGSAVA